MKTSPRAALTLALAALAATAAHAQTTISSGAYTNYDAGLAGAPYTISGGAFTGSGDNALTVEGGVRAAVSGGDFTTHGDPNHSALQLNAGASVALSGGAFHGSDDGVYVNQSGPSSLTLSAGTFTGNVNQGVFLGGGSLATVSGGTFRDNGQGGLYTQGGLTNVTGGDFVTAGSGYYDVWSDAATTNVYGGAFDSGGSLTAFSAFNGGTINFFGSLSFSDGLGGSSRAGSAGGGTITGTLADGTRLNADYGFFTAGGGTVNLNPGTTAATAYRPTSTTPPAKPGGAPTYGFTGVSGGSVVIGAGTYLGRNGLVYSFNDNPFADSIFIPSDITVLAGQGVSASGRVVPLNPDGTVPGGGVVPLSLVYVDPVPAYGYTYTMTGGGLFRALSGLPSGYKSPFDILAGGVDYGPFGPGQTLLFSGGGVSSFTVRGISPAVDGADPAAFPFQVAFSAPTASFTVTPLAAPAVPEAPAGALLLLGLLPVALRAARRRCSHTG